MNDLDQQERNREDRPPTQASKDELDRARRDKEAQVIRYPEPPCDPYDDPDPPVRRFKHFIGGLVVVLTFASGLIVTLMQGCGL